MLPQPFRLQEHIRAGGGGTEQSRRVARPHGGADAAEQPQRQQHRRDDHDGWMMDNVASVTVVSLASGLQPCAAKLTLNLFLRYGSFDRMGPQFNLLSAVLSNPKRQQSPVTARSPSTCYTSTPTAVNALNVRPPFLAALLSSAKPHSLAPAGCTLLLEVWHVLRNCCQQCRQEVVVHLWRRQVVPRYNAVTGCTRTRLSKHHQPVCSGRRLHLDLLHHMELRREMASTCACVPTPPPRHASLKYDEARKTRRERSTAAPAS